MMPVWATTSVVLDWKHRPASPGPGVPFEQEMIRKVFRGCDRNNDGVLDRKELREAFQRLGSYLPTLRAALGMHLADANGDGVISETELNELVKYAKKIGYKFYGY